MILPYGILFEICFSVTSEEKFTGFFMNHKIVEKMERDRYESPAMEIIEMEVEQPILNGSFTGDDIKEWEDMEN